MKTQKNKLDFKTSSIVELNDGSMLSVNGGTTGICYSIAVSSDRCVSAVVTVSIIIWTLTDNRAQANISE